MKLITKDSIKSTLRKLGVKQGDTIYLQSDLSRPGVLQGVKNRNDFCRVYLDAIFERIGRDGTLVVPTYTTQVARFDLDFIWEETPSLMGLFSEFVRVHPQSLRSIHPIKSVCAIGRRKEEICANNSPNDYGVNSPFHRILNIEAKALVIGLESGYAIGSAHHLEAACCLPYVYNKLLKWKPIINGVEDKRHYIASSRFLDLNVPGYDLTEWARRMRQKKIIKSFPLGDSFVHVADYSTVFMETSLLLEEKPFFMLKEEPKFTYGKVPFDGPTAGRDGIAGKLDEEKLQSINWQGFYLGTDHYIGGDDADL